MTITQAIILSIVEGLTEFLPISSTGHLVLVSNLLLIPQTNFVTTFEIAIQLGAILAVAWVYNRQLLDIGMWIKVLAAFIPTALLGLVFYDFVKHTLLGNTTVTVAALFLGGLILLFIDKFAVGKKKLSLKRAMGIGLFQSVSMIPGVSRAAATIIGGELMGLSREEAVKFSFFLAIPTILSATVLDLVKTPIWFSPDQINVLLIGFTGAFITALLAIKFLIKYIQNHTFKVFGVYRIIVAILFIFLSRI